MNVAAPTSVVVAEGTLHVLDVKEELASDSRRAPTDRPSPMARKGRVSSARISHAAPMDMEDDPLVVPRPVPRGFLRIVVVATALTIMIATAVMFRQSRARALPGTRAVVPATTDAPPPAAPPATALPVPPPPPDTTAEAVAPSTAPSAAPPPASAAAPVSVTPGGETPSAHALVAQAQQLLARGSYAHAVEVARRATVADPTNAEGWLTLGGAHEAGGNGAQARAAYRKCVELARGASVSECRALLAQ